ncbi:MAG TPA: hypothetical protein VN176_15770 [Verrucomicrobiae bacterium]|nr:hypothetical protein [Verrucomicrobiae bacterium]
MALLFVSLWSGSGVGQSHELWNLKLTGEGDIQSFERSGNALWATQQGVVFLTPERVLVYQVNETARPAPLGKRRPSGGGGNFLLTARILDASNYQHAPGNGLDRRTVRTTTSRPARRSMHCLQTGVR